jgi:apoptosis-inducing factor 3
LGIASFFDFSQWECDHPVRPTNQVGLFFRYVGHAKKWDEIIVHGNLSDLDFIVFYAKNNQIYAAAGNNRDREIAAIEELMRLNKMPNPDEIRNRSVNFVELLKNWNSRLRQAA